jgi:hypothetical protein
VSERVYGTCVPGYAFCQSVVHTHFLLDLLLLRY